MTRQHGGNLNLMGKQYRLKPEQFVDFSVNLNPLGPPPALLEAWQSSLHVLTRYPEPDSRTLKESAASFAGVPPEQLIMANGAVELIYSLVQSLQPRRVLIPGPTFGDYEDVCHVEGVQVKHFYLRPEKGFVPHLSQLVEAARNVDLVFICNPNNPTGHLWPEAILEPFLNYCAAEAVFVVLDESFLPFHPRWEELSRVSWTARHRNLFVLQSLTKFFAVPGLRIGYGVAHPVTITWLGRHLPPWQVNGIAQELMPLAFAAGDYARLTRDFLIKEREWLAHSLRQINGVRVYPSEAAYLLLELNNLTSSELTGNLAGERILVRDCTNFAFLGNRFIRVAVKDRQSNKLLIKQLQKLL
jgi:threonine-phosphate decarboxylase